ncbi:hypothetical protein M9Y10_010935, partial [Tritrichomonas musculus]
EYIQKMKMLQDNLLQILDTNNDNYENFQDIIHKSKILENKYEFKSFLHLIFKISNHHHRTVDFFIKIEKIFQLFKYDITKFFSNSEIFQLFKSNKRVLLILFDSKIIEMNEYISKIITNQYIDLQYPQYFLPEIQSFNKKEPFQIEGELPENFYEKRKIGENDNYICQLIQKDSINEFVFYTNLNNYSLDSTINQSIFETNSFLLKNDKKVTLIEYAAFFGSIKIFLYLRNKVEVRQSIWQYAIHSDNAKIINQLELNNIEPTNQNYEECFKESIKCHHYSISDYIQNNYLQNENTNDTLICCLKYYNFFYLQNDFVNGSSFYFICKYDYLLLANIILNEFNIDINEKIILNNHFQ